MANNDPRRRIFGRPALLLLATGGIITVSLWAGTQCLSQGMGGADMPGYGGGVGGPGQMGMGHSDQKFIGRRIPHHDGAIAMAIGFRAGCLRWRSLERRPLEILKILVFCFFSPALW